MEEKTKNFEEEFEKVYSEVYENAEGKLKKEKSKLNKFLIVVFIILIIINLIVYITAENKSVVTVTLSIAFCIMLFLAIQQREIYKKIYKDNVISSLIRAYNPKLYYDQKNGISKFDYTMSNFDTSFNDFFSEDQIYGTLEDGTKIRIAEVVTAITRKVKNEDGSTKEERTETYRGLYGNIKMPYNISGSIYIANDSITKRYNADRIELESGEFEKYYDCMSKEKVRALQILTSDLIEKFNEIRRNSKFGFELKIEDDMIYFRYKCGQLFEPPTFKSGLDKEFIKKYYGYIFYPLEIITKILENTKYLMNQQ